jgi:hypothetical protein
MDDLDPFFHDHTNVIAEAVAAETEAQRKLAAAVAAEVEVQRKLAAEIEAQRKLAMKYVQFPRRLEFLFRRGPAPNLPQGLGPSSPSLTQKPASTVPHALRRRGRKQGSTHIPKLRAIFTEYPSAWHRLKERHERFPTVGEMAWELDQVTVRTINRYLKRHPNLREQYPLSRKKR